MFSVGQIAPELEGLYLDKNGDYYYKVGETFKLIIEHDDDSLDNYLETFFDNYVVPHFAVINYFYNLKKSVEYNNYKKEKKSENQLYIIMPLVVVEETINKNKDGITLVDVGYFSYTCLDTAIKNLHKLAVENQNIEHGLFKLILSVTNADTVIEY